MTEHWPKRLFWLAVGVVLIAGGFYIGRYVGALVALP
jgi:hypothetical protein